MRPRLQLVDSFLPEVAQIMRNPAREPVVEAHSQFAISLDPTFCAICSSPTYGYYRCMRCNQHAQAYGLELADAVACLSYCGGTAQSISDFHQYKDIGGDTTAKHRLSILMLGYSQLHQQCMERRLGGKIDTVVHVPSGRPERQQFHPLEQMLVYFPAPWRNNRVRYTGPIRTTKAEAINPDHFAFEQPVAGKRILILEDTWVAGLNCQSVAVRARRDGARSVGILAIGRQLDKNWFQHRKWLDSPLAQLPFDPYFCPIERAYCH